MKSTFRPGDCVAVNIDGCPVGTIISIDENLGTAAIDIDGRAPFVEFLKNLRHAPHQAGTAEICNYHYGGVCCHPTTPGRPCNGFNPNCVYSLPKHKK